MTTNAKNAGGFDFAKFVSSMTALFKAVPQDKLADILDDVDHAGAQKVDDIFNGNEFQVPSRAAIGTGPAVSMRGGGVDAQIARNSDFAAQSGMMEIYTRFDSVLNDFGKSLQTHIKAQNDRISALAGVVSELTKSHTAIGEALKAATPTQPDVKVVSTDGFFGKAQVKLAAAQKAFRKAEVDEDDDDRETRKSKLAEVQDLLKSALKLITKADDEEAVEEDDVEKALRAVKTLKGRVDAVLASIVKAEEDEKKEKEEAAKAEAAKAAAEEAAQKAAAEEAAKKAAEEGTKEFTDEERKDDTAKAAQVQQMLEKALNGQATLEATVKGLMEQLSSASRVQPPPTMQPTVKAAPLASLEASVESGMSSLSPTECIEASTLLARHRAAAAGRYSADSLKTDVAGASSNVRRLFA